LKEQLDEKDNVLTTNNETEEQLQTAIDVLAKAEEANKRTLQELLEKQKKLEPNIDSQNMTEEALNRTVEMICGKPRDVSTYQLVTVTISKLKETSPAINGANLLPNILVC
jgi:chromosome segregation ATPase